MRRISILNFKGGTGKSSLTENLADALALKGQSVLVIDADRQGNAGTTLLGGRATSPTLTQVLRNDATLESAIRQGRREKLSVLPSDQDLDTASSYIVGRRSAYYTLRNAVQYLDYDFILFDHAGAYTPVMETALLASQEMIIPCELEAYAVQGLFGMFSKLKTELTDHQIRNSGIIPYNVDMRYSMTRQYLQELRKTFGDLVMAPIRTDATVPLAQSVQMTVLEYEIDEKIKSRAAEDFRSLAEDIIEQHQEEIEQ